LGDARVERVVTRIYRGDDALDATSLAVK
jgi:hypothetical protein